MANAEPTDRNFSDGPPDRSFAAGLRRRAPVYAILAVIGIAALAYVDGGEEPLHPIVQDIAVPQKTGAAS